MVRYTIFYNQDQSGWTETFYGAGNSLASDPANDPQWKDLFKKSLVLRANGTTVYGLRQTVVGANPKKSVFDKFDAAFTNNPPITQALPDVVTTDALVYMYNFDSTIKRPMYIRGVRDDWVKRDNQGNDTPDPALNAAIVKFYTAMGIIGAYIQFQTKVNAGATIQVRVTNVVQNLLNINQSDLSFDPAIPIVVGDKIQFSLIPKNDMPGFPRIAVNQKSVTNPALICTIPYRLRTSNGNTYFPATMLARKLVYEPIKLELIKFWRFSEHKAGRPFGSLRGRVRAVIRAR